MRRCARKNDVQLEKVSARAGASTSPGGHSDGPTTVGGTPSPKKLASAKSTHASRAADAPQELAAAAMLPIPYEPEVLTRDVVLS